MKKKYFLLLIIFTFFYGCSNNSKKNSTIETPIKLKKEDSSEWIADLTYNNGLAVISQYKIDSNGVVFAKENAIKNGKAQLKTILEERVNSLIKDTSYYNENLTKTIILNSEKYFIDNNSWIDENGFFYVLVVISNENLEKSIYDSIN